MSSPNIQRLREIKSFLPLVKYLRDELDWPIESEHFDDLTFDYEPEELGIEAKTAVKIKEIKQLRPLSSKQPWGIFFINFEPKQLPIVVLRRILRSLVIKKRVSANKSQQAAWRLHDLLFISAYGETAHREITFAHFSEPTDRLFGDLPTLRVLGWDADDTKLKIDHVVHILSEKLRWPGNENDAEAWRKKWSDAFELRPKQVINTSKELAILLADLAKSIRQRANLILAVESERGPLRKLHKAFQTALIHDLNEDDFADMYAQTIAYGLLAARVSRPAGVIADNLADMVPITNPFLKEMLGTFLTVGGRKGKIDFDELGIQEVVDLLNSPDTKMEAVLRDFGKRTMQEDPVIHFYELFLKEYDKKKKVERGVFYTPQPVVSYIVRSIHEILKTEFGLEDGLASTITWGEMAKRNPDIKIPEGVSSHEPFVQILDPATGTATFLVEVIEVIYKTMTEKWQKEGRMALEVPELWNKYVPKHLLPRLYGFELMMAPYAIAHMKIGLKLFETGYRFDSEERAHVYLTNSLEPPSDVAAEPEFEEWSPALAHEAKAVNAVKRNKRFTVVIGNPPYASLSQNMNEWARGIVEFYFYDDSGRITERGRRNQLQDDYVKFFRLGQLAIDLCGTGTLGFISNSSYTKGPWFRGMRFQLMQGFDKISILDLHGSQAHSLDSTEGDQNVFEILTPVAIAVLRKQVSQRRHKSIVTYSEIHGSRDAKYARLAVTTLESESPLVLTPTKVNQWRFVPHDDMNQAEWAKYIPIPDMFINWGAGVLTNRNGLAVAHSRSEVLENARRFADLTISDAEVEAEFGFSSNYQWTTGKARKEFAKSPVADLAEPYTFRPFDFQFIYWHKNLVYNMRGDKMEVFREQPHSLALMFSRNTKHSAYTNIYVTNHIADRHCLEEANIAPLYTFTDNGSLFAGHRSERCCNFTATFVAAVVERLNQRQGAVSPEEIFQYGYAVFYSPGYRSRYVEFLKIDFPRLPLTGDMQLFRTLAKLGGELVALHLMESHNLDKHITKFIGNRTHEVEKVSYSDGTVWIDKAKTLGFKGVPENVWNFHIGGYQVCEKWLKDRKGRILSAEDINHYHRIVVALSETIRIMAEIDKVIEAHGGWPDAFLNR